MNETTPKISVIVPVYKAEAYLHRCVDSLLAQTFQDFEILLVDDGSPDKSGGICDEYARKDRRVRVFHKENGGVSSARNLGLENAKGEWICFVDADDWVEGEYLKELYSDVLLYNVDFVIHGYKMITLSGDEQKCEAYSNDLYDLDTSICEMLVKQELYYRGSPCSKLYRNKILHEHNIYFDCQVHYGEDLCFVLDYLYVIRNVYFSSKILYNYIQYQNSSVRQMFSFDEEYAGYVHLRNSFCKILSRANLKENDYLSYWGWIASFLHRSILVIRSKQEFMQLTQYDWSLYAKYFQPFTVKDRIDKFVIKSSDKKYLILKAYLEIRRLLKTASHLIVKSY